MNKKLVIVTGGAQGIGCVIAEKMVHEGYEVAVFDNDTKAIEERSSQLPAVRFYKVDVSQEQEITQAIHDISPSNLFAVINNAAISFNKPLDQIELKDWQNVIGVNLTGPFLMAKYTSAILQKNKGSIVNIASTRALMSEAHTEAYSASKGGLLSLTHALAASLSPDVRVNAVSPGWIEVGHLKKAIERKPIQHTRADKGQHLVGRVGEPMDIAEMVCFLISEKAGFITGQNFVIDGGMTKKMIYV